MTSNEHIAPVPPPTADQYEKESLRKRLMYSPSTYPCGKCEWPVIDGFCCDTCGDTNPRYDKEGKRVLR